MKNQTGKLGEDFIAKKLEEKNYKIVCRNFRTRFGEIDIIAENDTYIMFVEVKTRKIGGLQNPTEAVDFRKQNRIRLAAQEYLQKNPSKLQPRFDVAAVLTDMELKIVKWDIIENAF